MGDRLRLAIGVLGNAASMLLYAAPILTFSRVIRKRSIEEFSCVPYVIALWNCFLYTWYGLPVVSYRWENFPVVTINGLGIILELSFILIYFWFASLNVKKKIVAMALCVVLVSSIAAVISAIVFHDHHHRKVFVGCIGLVASVAMYGSPLVVVKRVIQTESVEFMPFYLSFFSFLASSLWMAYGLLSHDLFLACPNLVGSPLGILQLVLYFKYRKGGNVEEPQKWDTEKGEEKAKNSCSCRPFLVTVEIYSHYPSSVHWINPPSTHNSPQTTVSGKPMASHRRARCLQGGLNPGSKTVHENSKLPSHPWLGELR